MPVYKVKPEKNNYPISTESDRGKKTYPSVCIPVTPEIIAALEVGGDVEVTLRGKVAGLESRASANSDDPYMNRNELRVELRVVEAEPADGADDETAEPEETMEGAISKGLGYDKKADGE